MPQYADDVRNPETPYVGPLSESGIRPGCKIVVKGKVEEGANRFHVNLQCGDEDGADVAFHLNPRFGAGVIVRNSFQGGWGEEERDLDEDFPFAEGENFTVIIHVGKRAFNVVIKGKKMLRYEHRIEDLSLVNTIAVKGDVTIRAVEVSEGGYLEYPYEAESQHVICRPEIPFEGGVPFGNLRAGTKIIIQGQVKEGPERFHINLMAGDDIAFHFNPRFGGEVVVRNTKQGGWGEEERECDGEFPFKEGENFEIAILCRRRRFQIFVNSHMFCFYNHRIEDLSAIDGIHVKGDVEIHSIQLQEKSKLHMMPFRDGSFFLGGELPFVVPLPEEMGNGTMISVCGIVNEDPDRFHINLQCGEDEDADVAFHFNPRFGKGVVVRNNREGGNWRSEQREDDGEFPFEANCYFQILFSCEDDCYKVAVNGKHLVDFEHRIPCDKVTHLLIKGAIRLVSVRIE